MHLDKMHIKVFLVKGTDLMHDQHLQGKSSISGQKFLEIPAWVTTAQAARNTDGEKK